jgi:hypothetical protein
MDLLLSFRRLLLGDSSRASSALILGRPIVGPGGQGVSSYAPLNRPRRRLPQATGPPSRSPPLLLDDATEEEGHAVRGRRGPSLSQALQARAAA